MKYIVASHRGPHGLLIVIADYDIVGQVFIDGEKELCVKGSFFAGEEKTEEEVLILLKVARHLHLTGKKVIEMALNMDLLQPNKILWVSGIPHAQMFSEV